MSVDPRTNCLAPTFWRGGVVDCGRCEPCQSKPPRMSDADFQRAMGREPADDRDAWKARAEKAEADFATACDVGRRQEARADQAEAQAAAMREAIEKLATCRRCECSLSLNVPTSQCEYGCKASPTFDDDAEPELVDLGALLSSDAGRTLLAELEALREVAEVARYACCDRDGDPTQQMLDAFAMLDAARKGEP